MAVKSQLEVMQGAVKDLTPQSQLARYVQADLKGGEHKHEFMMSVIANAILEAYKGNFRAIAEARALCVGKSRKAVSYLAGFQAVGDIAKIPYTGKLDAPANSVAREAIALQSQASEFAFETAFLTAFEGAAALASATAAARKAAQQKALKEKAVIEAAQQAADAPAAFTVPDVELNIGNMIDVTVDAITGGLLTVNELAMLRAALAEYDDANSDAPANIAALLAAGSDNPLLVAQAH